MIELNAITTDYSPPLARRKKKREKTRFQCTYAVCFRR